MNKERLLNVAKALRESTSPHDFKMSEYVSHCGTPACALGHYAARRDLQDLCVIGKSKYGDPMLLYAHEDESRGYDRLDYDDREVIAHFGINLSEAVDLFGGEGCGGAKTPIEAAEYIESFVAKSIVR